MTAFYGPEPVLIRKLPNILSRILYLCHFHYAKKTMLLRVSRYMLWEALLRVRLVGPLFGADAHV